MLEVVTILFPKEYERGDESPRKRDFLYGELYRCSNDTENIQSYPTVEKEENVLEKEIRKEDVTNVQKRRRTWNAVLASTFKWVSLAYRRRRRRKSMRKRRGRGQLVKSRHG